MTANHLKAEIRWPAEGRERTVEKADPSEASGSMKAEPVKVRSPCMRMGRFPVKRGYKERMGRLLDAADDIAWHVSHARRTTQHTARRANAARRLPLT